MHTHVCTTQCAHVCTCVHRQSIHVPFPMKYIIQYMNNMYTFYDPDRFSRSHKSKPNTNPKPNTNTNTNANPQPNTNPNANANANPHPNTSTNPNPNPDALWERSMCPRPCASPFQVSP